METSFTPPQLQDPKIALAEAILSQCVHCGFCNATCPTYSLSQDEADGPRGRIWIMRNLLTEDRQPDGQERRYLDRCLTCLSCTTTCPAGVDYRHLTDLVRSRIKRPGNQARLRRLLTLLLPHPGRLRVALALAALARPASRVLPGLLRRMVQMSSKVSRSRPLAKGHHAPQGERRMRVLMLTGCAQSVLDPEINQATMRLLTRLGAEVITPPRDGCCGAVAEHHGHHAEAQASIRRLLAQWQPYRDVDAVVMNASGCGFHVQDWGHVMADDPLWAEPARHFAAITRDISEIALQLGLYPLPHIKGKSVALHLPCSLQHGQKVTQAPKAALEAAGFLVLTPSDNHLCCGAAGTYALLQPEPAEQLRHHKAEALKATGATLVASSNMGCMNHLRPALSRPVVHLVQLLDWATGGPKPLGIV